MTWDMSSTCKGNPTSLTGRGDPKRTKVGDLLAASVSIYRR